MLVVTLANLRLLYGDIVERATLSRDLLAPAASRLSGDPSALHHRCVLRQYIGLLQRADDVRADLAPFDDIEAVAHCDPTGDAVIVFRTAAGAAAAVRRQEEAPTGLYSAVPPLDWALPLRFIDSKYIEVALYPPTPSPAASEAVSEQGTAEPGTGEATPAGAGDDAQWTPQPVEARPVIVFLNSPDEGPMTPLRGPRGTTQFVPSLRSKYQGPMLGADGHLWMDGCNITYYDKGMDIQRACIRVVQVPPPDCYY